MWFSKTFCAVLQQNVLCCSKVLCVGSANVLCCSKVSCVAVTWFSKCFVLQQSVLCSGHVVQQMFCVAAKCLV